MATSNHRDDSAAPSSPQARGSRSRGDSQSYPAPPSAHGRTPSSYSHSYSATQPQSPSSPRSQRPGAMEQGCPNMPYLPQNNMDSPDNIVHGREGSTIDQEFLNTNDGHSHEYMGAAPSGHHHVGSMNGQQDHPDSQNSGRNSAHIAPNQYIQQQSQQQQVQYAQDIIRRSFVQQQPYPQDPLRHSFIQQRPQSQAYPQDPLQQSVIQQPQQSLHGNGDSRASGYQRTSQMQVPRSPSLDYSEPPGSPLPPYVPRPPQPVKLPHYYQEIHHETQAPGQMEFMDPMDERRGYGGGSGGGDALWTPGNSRSHLQNEEEDIFQSAGQFNPEASRGRRKKKRDDDDDNRGECWTTLKDIAELCPCLCFCCLCFVATN